MKLPTKFKLNTEDFKIYFDDKKKTHVCENVETGEQTNIGVLGIFLQMGILEQIEKGEKTAGVSSALKERLNSLEERVINLQKSIDGISVKGVPKQETPEETIEEPAETEEKVEVKEEKKDTSEIKKRVMENVIEKVEETEKPKKEEPAEDVTVENEEEINNWMDI